MAIKDLDLEKLTKPLLEWYEENKRELPWRSDSSPYRVWVSEIMLQQTRVEAVKPFFERFTKRLPDVKALAECEEDDLLKLWEGLGYYNRVRNMQMAARQIMEDYQGELPASYEELLKLKGIGSYTAGAIGSIAFKLPVPAVDGNVLRILTRVAMDDTDIMKTAFRKEIEQRLGAYMQGDKFEPQFSGAYNQALMELGATVCVPNGVPDCGKCPWQEFCQAHKEERMMEFPVKAKAKERRIEKRTVFVIRDGERVAIHKRPAKGLLAGLYELPNVEGELSPDEVLEQVKQAGFAPLRIQKLEDAKHIFSHVEWHMSGYAILVEETEEEKNDMLFVEAWDSKERYAIPAAFAVYAGYMGIKIGQEKFLE